MRSRQEITQDWNYDDNSSESRLFMEVLFDIRDLLDILATNKNV